MILQAGDSEEGREFAAADADAIFTRHGTLEAGQAFYADVKGRLARYGREPDDLKILPAATFVLGDTDADAAREGPRRSAASRSAAQTAIKFARAAVEPRPVRLRPRRPAARRSTRSSARTRSPRAGPASGCTATRSPIADEWRALAEAKKLSLRELDHRGHRPPELHRHARARSPAAIDEFVQTDASDGFILVPHITPGGLDEFVDKVVPLLQERGAFRTEYTGTTLREHLGLRPRRG